MELGLSDFVVAVLWGALLLVGFFSVVSRFLHGRAERRLAATRTVCRLCGHVFATSHSGGVAECKSCGKPNLHRHNGSLG
ncbi:hypothetical protein HZ994_00565 [Akkermansiaceae bacterium]|nr:hypothetical protein HZ994_00565 [Akkermansiaceae bacterium]